MALVVSGGGQAWRKAGREEGLWAGRLGGGGEGYGFAPPETWSRSGLTIVEQARRRAAIGRLLLVVVGGVRARAGAGGPVVIVGIGVGAAGLLEGSELGEGLLELAGEVALVADEVIDVGGLGEDALAAEIGELAGVGAEGRAGGVDGVADGFDGGGDELLRREAGLAGGRVDEQAEAPDRPFGDVLPGDVVRGDLGHGDGVEVEGAELLVDGRDDLDGGGAGDERGRRGLDEAGEAAEAGAGSGEAVADGLRGVGRSEGVVPTEVEIVEGAPVGAGGDVALVAGDALEAPEDEGDALGEVGLEPADGGAAGDGAAPVPLPGGGTLEAVDDGGSGVEAVAGGVPADDGLAEGGAGAGGAEGVAAVGGDLPIGRHEGGLSPGCAILAAGGYPPWRRTGAQADPGMGRHARRPSVERLPRQLGELARSGGSGPSPFTLSS